MKNKPEKQFSLSDVLQQRTDLTTAANHRRNEFAYRKIDSGEKIPDGWEIEKELQTSTRIKKLKDAWKLFEDRLWLMFYKFEFEDLNKDYEPEIILSAKQQQKVRFDVIGKAEEFVFFVECRSKNNPGTRSDIRETIIALNDAKPHLKKLVREHYDNDYLEVVMVLALENIQISEQEINEAKRKGVKIWDTGTIKYLEQLADLTTKIGPAARYQIYAMMFPEKKHQDSVKIPAIQCRAGKITYYSFMTTPEQLLRISYVHRRGSSIQDVRKVVLTYQRMLETAKLKAITEYISKQTSLPFPNNVIINFDEKVNFELAPGRDNINNGMLRLPRSYGAAWIIDGQHRLFGYALSERRKKDLLPVIAFEKLSDAEQARLFVDINLNQKSVSPNLLWDLKEDIYEGTEDKKQRRDLIISKIGKRLATSPSSPLYHEVSLPSYPELSESAPVTLNAICATIKSSGILGVDYYGADNLKVEDAVDTICNGLLVHFGFFATSMKFDWDLGKQGFTKSANGISAQIWLFRQTLHYLNYIEDSDLYRTKSKKREFSTLINELYQPIIEQFRNYKDLAAKLRMKRGASGQKESANDLCIYIQSATPDFPSLLKSQMKITSETDLSDDDAFDLAIKNTELKLRAFTKGRLKNSFGHEWYKQRLPGDVKQNIDEFVNSDIKKFPYKQKSLNSLEKRFEYIQLTDLKKVVTSSWQVFQEVFSTKEGFTNKVEEFISLRNAFRGHPRQIDDAQRKLGHGAMIWLNQCVDNIMQPDDQVPEINDENDSEEENT